MDAGLTAGNLLVILVALVGVFLTVIGLPGNWLIFFTAISYGFFDSFIHINSTVLFILLGAVLTGEFIEFVAGSLGAKKENASRKAIFAAFIAGIIGGILGTGIMPGVGSILGAVGGSFIAGYVAEYAATGNREKAVRVAQGIVIGQAVGLIVKLAIAIGMVAFIISRLTWTG
ncbi:DUF456 domain-containing protein [Sporomusa acidovorans]|uniref:DUF456 domain-containing protein n=1 Tax=Sporomusa acidovorans (strain ATCC 49682 / DSM 3132 / Mol) TaxID=1123286 RepID=A0ABZ3J522_SPOA4|nr:DUF456 domain-containing protein [Sporomusa acidovorans]OZC23931.1 hypothetical protein SPACI_03490 [Sporomusa acidovorans DSM 3132]SDF31382.1 hypothetical protein SAMN04488499_104318 [Sporomusa acidovorans]